MHNHPNLGGGSRFGNRWFLFRLCGGQEGGSPVPPPVGGPGTTSGRLFVKFFCVYFLVVPVEKEPPS